MSAGKSQNLPGPLEQAEAVYRSAAAQLPVTGATIARQARHFAADARLSRDEPQAMRRLHELTGGLGDLPALGTLLPRVLDGAVALTGADFGTLQLLDPVTDSLRLVTHSGFDPGFLEYFAVVDDGHSACGRAAREAAQTVIADVHADPGFAPHRGIAAASGFRAVQSTPLVDDAGHLVGVLSTHFRRPHRPPGLDLRIMVLYADVAAQAIAGRLGAPDEGLADPAGRAVIPAPLDLGNGQGPGVAALPVPAREAASLGDTMSQLAGYVVNRLFAVGLSLESARSIVGEGPAGDRVAAATGQVDRMIGDVRTLVFSLAADRENHRPGQWDLPPGGYADRTGESLAGVVDSVLEAAEPGRATQPGAMWKSSLDGQERSAPFPDRAALLQERMARTARGLHAAAADYAELLEQNAALTRQPGSMDYPTEVKRWRVFADQAAQMAERWEQPPERS